MNIERQLPGNIVLTTGYAGTRSTHILFYGLNLNINSPAACAGGPLATPGYTLGCGPGGAFLYAPYPTGPGGDQTFNQFTNVQNVTDGARARYDSLQIKAETKSVRHGLYALVGYTWSRTFDTGMADGDGTFPGAVYWPLPGTHKLDWGLSQLNLNDAFTASVLYDLPFGKGKHFGSDWSAVPNAIAGDWHVNVIEKATSGVPLFLIDSANGTGVNFQWNGSSLNRPIQISDPYKPGVVMSNSNPLCHSLVADGGIAPAAVHTTAAWFNPCAYDHAPAGELSTLGRSPLSGPRFVNTDFSLFKNFPIHENYTVQFRAEFFNLFNHAQFYLPGGPVGMQDLSSISSFGVIYGTVNNPRVVQLALRLDF